MHQEIKEELKRLAQTDYKAFNEKLIPGETRMLGVRVPKLRALAKQIAASDARAYLTELSAYFSRENDAYYEEKLLYGLVIGYAKMPDADRIAWLERFVPVIDSWGVCDSCCATYKWMKKNKQEWWQYLLRWILTDTEFGIRFGLVSMLDHFVDEEHLDDIFAVCNEITNREYYARMALAWLVSVCFAKFPERTFFFLQTDRLDDFAHNKAIQKTCESYRVSAEWKARVRGLCRKCI